MAKFFSGEKISAIHGRARKKEGYICIPMFHPAAALRTESYKIALREDFKKIPLALAEAERLAAEASAKLDRKSTRLNSSHGYISYAVFCLKKKNKTIYYDILY